ncbi:Carboxypeptidase [Fusarium sp. LHS14.1]|nr:Carboxypeptidase [Fusarium sp. LHS14.1]
MRISNALFWALLAPAQAMSSNGYVVHKSKFDPPRQMRVKSHPEGAVCAGGVASHSGWADLGNHHIFFWYYESRSAAPDVPVMVWFTGGPGGSSQASALVENGDCKFDRDSHKPTRNPYGWTEEFHMVYIDQPVGVGFSYLDHGNTPSTTDEAAPDVVGFLRLFAELFPHLAKNPLHLAGESYGGRWIPVFGDWVNQYNKVVAEEQRIPLASLIAISAWSHPRVQLPTTYDVACWPFKGYPPALNDTTCAAMAAEYESCRILLEACDASQEGIMCSKAAKLCHRGILDYLYTQTVNKYDRRMVCPAPSQCYPIMDEMEAWMNTEPIFKDLLDITNQTSGKKGSYQFMDSQTYLTLVASGDLAMNSLKHIETILEDRVVPVLYTASDADMMVNIKGVGEALDNMRWHGRPFFKNAPFEELPFKTNAGRAGGRVKKSGNLWYAELAEAGHMAPYDQPAVTLELMKIWLAEINHGLVGLRKDDMQSFLGADL